MARDAAVGGGRVGLVREEPRKAGEVVRAILKMDCDGDDACTNVLLAGACLEDVGEMGLSRAVANEVKDALLVAAKPIALAHGSTRCRFYSGPCGLGAG